VSHYKFTLKSDEMILTSRDSTIISVCN